MQEEKAVAQEQPRFTPAPNALTQFPGHQYIYPDSEAGFLFQPRSGRLRLREIARIDVDDLVQNVDVEVLQEFLENICFADVSKEDVSTFTDEAFVKLFRLTQLIIEYLLNVQDQIYGQSVDVARKHDKVVRKLKVSSDKLVTNSLNAPRR